MSTFAWIFVGGIAMAGIALVGGLSLVVSQARLDGLMLPLVAFAAGSLIGGAFFFMLPAAMASGLGGLELGISAVAGFTVFFLLEQLFHWHHCQRARSPCRQPLTYLLLIGDGLHNFLGGLAIAGTFMVDFRLGVAAWLAAAAHEIPQELGDFGVLVHGGWSRGRALLFNFLSGLTFLAGGLVGYGLSTQVDTSWLIPFAAGNFIYIAAADLVPEINRHADRRRNLVHAAAFLLGIAILLATAVLLGG